jgi:prophage maintenance system killer protein
MAGQPLKFVTDQQVADIHEKLMACEGGRPGYRQGASLSAVLERVRNRIRFGGVGGTCPERIAALVTFALCIGQPFNDGNRRTALACGMVILSVNDRPTEPEPVQLVQLIVAASSGTISQEAFTREYLVLLRPAQDPYGRLSASS